MKDVTKKFGKSAEEIMAIVDGKVSRATAWIDSNLASERSRMQRYYDGALPKRQSEGSSSYVSSDVYDGVESMKSQILEVFAGGHDIIRFKPMNDQDVDVARIETAYVADQIMNENDGFDRMSDVIDDSLKNRTGVVQIFWENIVQRDDHTFSQMPYDDVQALLSQDDVEMDATQDEEVIGEMSTYSGVWTRVIDNSGLRVENVPPEEYFSEGSKKSRTDGARGRKVLKTRAELIEDGYDKQKVMDLPTESELSFSEEKQSRDRDTNDGIVKDDAAQAELETVLLYETFIRLSLRGDGKAALFRIVHCGGTMFEMDEVEEDNFLTFTPLRRPHSQHGTNFAKKIVPTQNARTVLTRAILDHTATTVNPRWQVLNGALTNPKELLDNRLRGIVNVKMRDGIAPLQYPNLNPFTYQTLEMLKSNKEETTGMSALSQGLNKDAVSTQNSKGLVDNLVTLSQVRQKIIARNFANFLSALFLKARKLVLENESREKVFEFDNTFQKIDPRLWTPNRKVQVSLHVGYGEQEKEAAKFAQLWGLLSTDPKASLFCPPEQQHKLLTDGIKKNGFANVADYIVTADKIKPPGPDPLEMMKAETAKMTAEAAMLQARSAWAKAEGTQHINTVKVEIASMLAEVKKFVAERDADRKDMDVANDINVSQREMELAESVPEENQKGIFSPN